MQQTATRLRPFGTSVFSEMTTLANQHGAINLSQGFPDFDGPPEIIEAAFEAMKSGHNQYARSMGHPLLVEAVADKMRTLYGLDYDAMTEVTVFCGATEGIAASMLGLLDPGDEVILFEPFYDSYPACTALAGAQARFCTLRFPDFALDVSALRALFNERTRLLVLNSPHNPTGKVFTRTELEAIAWLCREHDVIVISDEVYEHLTFDGAEHIPIASLPGMRERTITLSSTGKTFSYTGWKIGWATGPAPLVAAAQAAHQFITFCAPAPLQVAMAAAIRRFGQEYLDDYRAQYAKRRRLLLDVLADAGFEAAEPSGTYFVVADFSGMWSGDDRSFARHLIETVGVAAIPPSAFYQAEPEEGRKLLRFAFCKRLETIEAAGERLRRLRG